MIRTSYFSHEITKILPFKVGDSISFDCHGKDQTTLTGGLCFHGVLCNVYVLSTGDGAAPKKHRSLIQGPYLSYSICMIIRTMEEFSPTEMCGSYTLVFPIGLMDAPEFCNNFKDNAYSLEIGSDDYNVMLYDDASTSTECREYWTIKITDNTSIEIAYDALGY